LAAGLVPALALVIAIGFAWPAAAGCVWGNCQDGRGTFRHPDGAMETGIWEDGKLVVSKGRSAPVVIEPREREQPADASKPTTRQRARGCVRGSCVDGEGVRTYRDGSNYEGRFRNGVRSGRGTQTWRDGRRYEGSWMADRRHGNGVQTYRNSRYGGTWRKGSPTRDGVRTYRNGDRYVGDYKRERRHGHGTLTFADGDRYVGKFRDDAPHGAGTWYGGRGGVREGHWARGKYIGPNGSRVQPGLVAGGTGCVAGDCWAGKGRFVYEDGSEYVGTFREGEPHGRGSLTHPDGRIDSGRWDDGKRTGRRVLSTPGAVASWKAKSRKHQSCLSGDCRNGKGHYRWKDGSSYQGAFQDSRPHGKGIWQHPDGSRYDGGWRHGNRDGEGSEKSANGVVRSGVWRGGRFQLAGLGSAPKARKRVRLRWPDLTRAGARIGGGEDDAAVIVGIERYAHVSRIPGAVENATAWYEHLVRSRGIPVERVQLLLDNDATREDMQWAIDEAARQVGDDGTLWFVFVGHGAPARDQKDGLLIGFDAQQKARSIHARGLRRSDLLSRLEASKAENIRVLLDACFSGRAGNGQQLVAGLQPLVVTVDDGARDPRTTLFTAARNDEFAGPLPGADRPAFSYLALGGLRGWADEDGNGRVTAGELHNYVRTALQALVRDRRQRNTFSGSQDSDLSRRAREKGPELSSLVRELAKRSGAPASR
jgi:hypothetical protein